MLRSSHPFVTRRSSIRSVALARRGLFVTLALLLVAPGLAEAGKKKKKGKEPAPVGWQTQEGWLGQCYHPPEFEAMGSGDRRMAWQSTRNELFSQWQGEKGDGITFSEKVLTNLETALLGKPERIEDVSRENLKHCMEAMAGKGAASWESWINGLPAQLTAGECPNPPMDYTLFDYLNISAEWQIPVYVCKDDRFRITASTNDYYKITADGPWINADGDPDQAASGTLPCNIEGCFRGQLVMRFKGESGVEVVKPVGTTVDFIAPEHGKVEVMLNDDTWYDNAFKVESGIEHHTSIEYAPVK